MIAVTWAGAVAGGKLIDLVDLIARCRTGDVSAWGSFDEWFREKAERILRWYGFGHAEREDLMAEARKRVVEAIQQELIRGQTSGEIASYMAAVIKHHAIDVLKERRPQEVPSGVRDPGPGPGRTAIARADLEKAMKIIQSWPEKDRFLFMERIHGTSASKIQEDLARHFGENVSVATVDSRFSKRRQELRDALGRTGRTEPERGEGPLNGRLREDQ